MTGLETLGLITAAVLLALGVMIVAMLIQHTWTTIRRTNAIFRVGNLWSRSPNVPAFIWGYVRTLAKEFVSFYTTVTINNVTIDYKGNVVSPQDNK